MAFKLVDDYSGDDLDRDHPPLEVRVGLEGWALYLSDKSKKALLDALQPFVKDAEPLRPRPSTARSTSKGVGKGGSTVDNYGFETKEVREWAIANKVTQDNGNDVGERGRLSQGVYDAFKAAQK